MFLANPTLLLVLLVELVHSSIEAVIDRISLERHELSARARDCESAAVTLSIAICILTWGTQCVPVIIRWASFLADERPRSMNAESSARLCDTPHVITGSDYRELGRCLFYKRKYHSFAN
nr:diacylglycerol kinase [Caballeronia sp. ATUFL_M2_KS44]